MIIIKIMITLKVKLFPGSRAPSPLILGLEESYKMNGSKHFFWGLIATNAISTTIDDSSTLDPDEWLDINDCLIEKAERVEG